MATCNDVGIIDKTILKKTYEEAHIEWRVSDFFSLAKTIDALTSANSPTFTVYDASWFLELYPKAPSNKEFTRVYLSTKTERGYDIEYGFSLKNSVGKVQQLVSGILEGNQIRTDKQNLIKFSEVLQRKSELAPENVLTIICKLNRRTTYSIQPNASDKTMPMKLIRLDKLSENFKNLFGDQETCDTTLKVKDKEYKAHKSVLIARSTVFAATFKHDTLERQTGIITITDCDPDSFAVFLEYVYSGKLEELSVCSALNLYYTCDKYDVQEVKTFCIEYLMQQLTVENVCEVAVFADKYDETALFSTVQDFFNENAGKIFATSEWQCFMKKENRLASKLLLEMSKVKLKG